MPKKELDITIKKISDRKFNGFISSKLVLQFSGSSVSYKIVNCIRRISSKYIPMYAFDPDLIKIIKNTSDVFNNDFMRLRISHIPIFGIDSELDFIPNNDISRIKGTKNIVGHIYAKNKSQDVLHVTTHDIKLEIDNIPSDIYTKASPIGIIQLKQNEIFNCTISANICIGLSHDIWSGTQNGYHSIDNDGNTKLTMESAGKLDNVIILKKTCVNIIEQLKQIKIDISQNENDKEIDNNDVINIFNFTKYDYSIIDIMNDELQNDGNVIFSGINKPNHLGPDVILKIKCKNDIKIVINTAIEILIEKFKHIASIISKF